MMQLEVTTDFEKRSLKFKPGFPTAAKLETVELVIRNPDGKIKTAGLSFIIYSARCGGRKLAVCDALSGTGTITGTLNLCTDRMVSEFYHLPLGTRRSFHAVLWSEADQWMIGAGRICIANNPGADSLNPAPLPANRYPTFEEVEEMIRNGGGLGEPAVRRVNGTAPDNSGNVLITVPGDVSELEDRTGLTLTVQQKNALATLGATYAVKNHTHSEYALKSELPDISGFVTADRLNLYQLKANAFSGKYADLTGKPATFPPGTHTHVIADVNGLADELNRKLTVPAGGNAGQFLMKTVSGCGWSSIDLASYITITQARNEFAAKTHEHSQYALASALQDYAAKVHTHIIGDVTGLQDALDGKADTGHNHDSAYAPKEETATALNSKLTIPAGGTAGQVIGKTSDGYGWITVSGGASSWDEITGKPSTFTPAAHSHSVAEVTGLQTALDGKSAAGHTHTAAEVAGLAAALSGKVSSVNGATPDSSGAVTIPEATSGAAGLMSAADKTKLDGLDATGSSGDMLKSVYDTDNDGIVDHAATADTVGATTAAQVADAVGKAHTHANKTTLDKFGETDGKLTFDGAEIGGGSSVDESRLLPDPVNYGQQNNGWRVGLEVLGIEDRDDFLCLYTLNEIVQGLPLDATGKTTATNQGVALELVEDEGAFEGKAVRRASTQNSSVANKLVIPMPEISGPFTLDIRFKAGAGSPGVGGEGTTYALAGAAVTTPAGQLGYHCGDVSPFKAVLFNALEYRVDSHGLPWKVFDSPGWYWFRMCRNNTAVYVFMNGEKVNSTTNSQALVTIPAGNWTILPSDTDSDVLLDEVRITNTCESTDDYAVPTESTGGISREWKLYSESAAPGSDVDESRLLPDPTTVSASLAGHPVVFDVQEQGGAGDANTLLLMHFDDDTVDYSPNAHSATKTGDVAFQTGKFGKCLKFASASGGSYLQIPYSTAFNLASLSAWTFDVLVYISQTPGYNAILAQRSASSPVSYQFCFSRGTRKPQLYTGSAYVATGEVPLNTWTHVAFTYLNGTLKIWIGGQLDSTFTNVSLTDYDLPVKIGYHYSSTTEQFIGLLDELRLSSCDRTADPTDPMYSADGTSFTPPAKPYGVTSNRFKVSESGVVTAPADPADGDIPCFDATATTGGGNDSTTKLLLQPATSNNQIVDQAAGNAAPVTLQNTGVTVDDAGAMVFDGNSYLALAASALPAGFLDGTDDWTLDLIYNVSSKSTQCLFGRGTSPRMDFLLQSSGALEIGGGPSLGGNWPFNTDVRLTFELYKDGSSWKYTAFRDGSVVTSGTWSSANWRSVALWIGWDGDTDSRKISGKIKALRLTAGASHKGVAFTPDELPWTQAQVVGEWGKLSKATIPVLEAEPVYGNLMLYTTQTFNVSDTMHLLHFDDPDQWFKDETGNYTGAATRSYYAFSTNITKFGTGGLQYQDPNGTSEYKTRSFNIASISPLKGPQDAVTLEFWFYIDQSCIFEIPDIMAKKGTAAEHWNFHLVNKMIYPDDIATPVKDVAVLSYHDFDEVSTYTKVETPWSRPTISEGWHHFAFCRDSAYNHYVFLDGAMLLKVLGSQFGSSPYLCPIVPDATTSSIGCDLSFDTQVLCYQDELRYSSVCLYTKNFVPPSEPFTYDAEAANKDVTGWFPASPGVIGLITGINNLIPSASGKLTIPEASKTFPGLMSATDKAKLDGLGTASSWYTVAYAAAITPDRANGELQKVTLTGDCTLTAPVLDADQPTLLLQVTSASAVTVTVGETAVVSGKSGTWQIGWYWDGEATRRYPAVEVA